MQSVQGVHFFGRVVSTGLWVTLLLMWGCSPPVPPPVEEGKKTVNGVELYYKAIGRGEPVFVVHGGPGLNHTYFLPHLLPLANSYRLIFYDQRASGLSSSGGDSSAISLENFIKDIDSLRQSFGLEKITLLGHSWGGLLAMLYAARYPEQVKSLILVNPIAASSAYKKESDKILRARLTTEDLELQGQIMRTPAFRRRDPTAINAFYRVSFRTAFNDRRYIDSLFLHLPDNFAENSARLQALHQDLADYDFYDQLARIACPTLIVYGTDDAVPRAAIDRMQQQIPDAKLELLEGCAHFPFIECKTAFFKRVRAFLAAQAD